MDIDNKYEVTVFVDNKYNPTNEVLTVHRRNMVEALKAVNFYLENEKDWPVYQVVNIVLIEKENEE